MKKNVIIILIIVAFKGYSVDLINEKYLEGKYAGYNISQWADRIWWIDKTKILIDYEKGIILYDIDNNKTKVIDKRERFPFLDIDGYGIEQVNLKEGIVLYRIGVSRERNRYCLYDLEKDIIIDLTDENIKKIKSNPKYYFRSYDHYYLTGTEWITKSTKDNLLLFKYNNYLQKKEKVFEERLDYVFENIYGDESVQMLDISYDEKYLLFIIGSLPQGKIFKTEFDGNKLYNSKQITESNDLTFAQFIGNKYILVTNNIKYIWDDYQTAELAFTDFKGNIIKQLDNIEVYNEYAQFDYNTINNKVIILCTNVKTQKYGIYLYDVDEDVGIAFDKYSSIKKDFKIFLNYFVEYFKSIFKIIL